MKVTGALGRTEGVEMEKSRWVGDILRRQDRQSSTTHWVQVGRYREAGKGQG